MIKSQVIADLTNESFNGNVSVFNDIASIGFYQKANNKGDEVCILALSMDTDEVKTLPNKILTALGEKTTEDYKQELEEYKKSANKRIEELEQEVISLQNSNDQLSDLVEQYDNNLEEYKEKISLSNGPF